jgi:hypothetical protein
MEPTMNAWILSLVICSAAPQPPGDACIAHVLAFGLTRQQCLVQLDRWSRHRARPRLECFEDPALTAELHDNEADDRDKRDVVSERSI